MRVAILETIVMPAGHEVEFDRILVDELKNQGHTPIFFVPKNYPFKIDYKCEVVYLDGGEAVSYAGVGKFTKCWLSLIREKRRIAWLDSAYEKVKAGICDAIIVPTNSWRVARSIKKSKIQISPVPVLFMMHGIMPGDRTHFIKGVKLLSKYKNIHIGALGLQTEFTELEKYKNFHIIMAPVYKPMDLGVKPEFNFHNPLRLGFYGQYRKEKNLEFFLKAFDVARFTEPVKLIVQGATVTREDSNDFERLKQKYSINKNIEFIHKSLLGIEWQQTLMDCDVMLLPYGAERYRYQPSAMLFTAIGYFKPVLQSAEMNPEILAEFKVGEVVNLDSVESFSNQLENFVNTFRDKADEYKKGLIKANEKYSHENLIKSIISILFKKKNIKQKYIGISYHLNEMRQQIKFHKDLLRASFLLKKDMKEKFDRNGTIPKVIHYAWFGPGKYNDLIKFCMETWKQKLPDYEIKFWTEKNFPINQYPFAKEAFERGKWVFISDIVRLHALYTEGGVYLDTDVEVLKSFDELLNNDAFMSYESHHLFNIGTFGAKKGHPFVKALLDWYKFVHCDEDYTEIASTRIMNKITRMLCDVKLHGQEVDLPFGVHIYPKDYLCPDMVNGQWQATDETYAVHHFTGLW